MMRPALLAFALMNAGPALAQVPSPDCRFPDDLALTAMSLPAVHADVTGKKRLTILAVGGSSTAGLPARGAAFTYPARLEAHLQTMLPGIAVSVVNRGRPASTTLARVDRLAADLAEIKPDLVIWAPGSSEAGMSEDPDAFATTLQTGLEEIRAAGANLIFIDLQYAPSIARVIDLGRYNAAIEGVANGEDVPVLRRSELMQRWNDDGTFDLDHTPPANRVAVIRHLFDCIAYGMAAGIAEAAK